MGKRKKIAERVTALMDKPEMIRNIGIVAHIDHGKTTLSDNLLAGAGMISMDLAGKQLFMDFDPLEQARGITIDAANVSMVHEFDGTEYLINMIDTPGHVDFGGDVTRAMRAVDGAVVVVDAVEGAMPQTETVLRQAIREGVRPVLFVNKVDRMINELKVEKKEMAVRLGKVIDNVNKLIRGMDEEKYKAGWRVDAANGSVAFGSALYNWAISVPQMKKTGIGFEEVFDYCRAGKMKELAEKVPLYMAVNDMVIRFLPSPMQAQKERVKVIWHGNWDSKVGKAMAICDPNGPVAFMITKIKVDPHAGEVATGRLFSGTLERGMELQISGMPGTNRIQQTGIMMGAERVEVESIPAGNIAAVTGLRDAIVGSTVSSEEMTPFEVIKHVSEPVMTVAVEAKNMRDLPKLIEVLRQVAKEDPTLQININEETGEHLMAGMGELHLEIVAYRITRDKGVEIKTTPPIVVYRESIVGSAGPVEGKSPNHHNRFYIEFEPLEPGVIDLLKEGKVNMKMEEIERRKLLIDAGMDKEQARNLVSYSGTNMFLNMTKGVQYLRETMELILEGFEEAITNGPICREPVQGIKAKLVDVKLHEDAIHRGPAQVIPAVRQAVQAGILMASPTLLEPMQNVFIQAPQDQMGGAMSEVQARRGIILNMETQGDLIIIKSKMPVSAMFGFAGAIRSATEGRAMWSTEFAGFEPIPSNLMAETVKQIRSRKGLKAEMPTPADYLKA
ncbi:MAG: Elongation factor 2 [Methanosaeta sp. PtaB.Bin039]|nr:MAG: Elongation factor 2 [Methanosaeta sp. PtaB.Bin039]HOT06638.1 elongation factor EF-2 [Methanotrichaceae archaeon]HQF16666.1 elongation factor EF-2 [Methanotrichaceae archaeon]HQI91322.1 elongation factor EF-2 [Methanotrichaceae archaeon]HQJ28736.1 elongation factor EF-2 [Methanotrichaceae archaeon]